MPVALPSQPVLAESLFRIAQQLQMNNALYQATTYAMIQVYLQADAGYYWVRDYWVTAEGPGGSPWIPPPNGVITAITILPSETIGTCTTKAATMIAAIQAKVGAKNTYFLG
jgi:hypothetical protein